MKRIIIIYGLLSGAFCSVWMLLNVSIVSDISMNMGVLFGYATMLLAFSLIFVAVKKYRDKYNQGNISFGKAFRIGLLISLIASTIYVVSWLLDFYFFNSDFIDLYTQKVLAKLKASGASEAEILKQTREMNDFAVMYKKYPLFNAAVSYMEILPMGLLVSLLVALIMKRKAAPAQVPLE